MVKEKTGDQPIDPVPPLRPPPFTTDLPLDEVTFAEILRKHAYETGFFGKWHLNAHFGGVYLGWSPTHGPAQQGFSTAVEDFGSHPYSGSYTVVEDERDGIQKDGVTERAIQFMRKERDGPFLLMVSHFFVHTPVKSRYPWISEKYRKKIPSGAHNRDNRIAYAEFTEVLDYHVGQLLAALDELGLSDNTVVVFMSDNGGHPLYTDNRPLNGSKWNLYEGGIRVPMMVRWPGRIVPGSVGDFPVTGCDLLPTFLAVANLPEMTTGRPIDGQNILPQLMGVASPTERNLYWHFPYYHPEGPLFGEALDLIGHADGVVSKTRPHSAMRLGRYKLLHFYEDDRIELYDLLSDPTESLDMANAQTAVAQCLKLQLKSYLDSVGARLPVQRNRLDPVPSHQVVGN